MESRHLRSFVAAAEDQHFGRAAKRLGIAQPALSRHVADLEKEVGCALFDRVSRGVRLNPAGETFLEDARKALGLMEAAAERARRTAEGKAGRLAIAFDEAAAWSGIVPTVIAKFRIAYPDITMDLRPQGSPDQAAALADGRIDGGFLYDLPTGARDLSAVGVAVHGLMLALPVWHAKAASPTVTLKDLANERFVTLPRDHGRRAYGRAMAVLDQAGIAPSILEAETATALLGLVACGAGVALVNSEARQRRPNNVSFVALADVSASLPLYFAWRSDNRAPALDAFRTLAIKESQPA